MAGETTTTSLADSLPLVVAAARQVREQPGGFVSTVRRETLEKGTGTAWRMSVLDKIEAQAVGQTQKLDNPQELSDTIFSIEPEMVGVHVIYTRKMLDQVSANVVGQAGGLMQNAIQRKKEIDGFAVYDGASFSQPGAGNTLVSGVISALVAQIDGNTTEPAAPGERKHAWLHPFQIHDLQSELTAGVGTYVVQPGASQEAYERGSRAVMMVGGAEIHAGGNIRIDANGDAHGGVHAQNGIILVEWEFPDAFEETLKNMGGAQALWLYDGYAYGEASNGLQFGRVLSDATAPTS